MLTVTDDAGKPQHDDDDLTLPLFLDLYVTTTGGSPRNTPIL
jgi:hypothetical protein